MDLGYDVINLSSNLIKVEDHVSLSMDGDGPWNLKSLKQSGQQKKMPHE